MTTRATWFLCSAPLLTCGLLGGCAHPTPCPDGRNLAPVAADPGFLEQYAATFRFRLGQPKGFALTPSGDRVLFLRSQPRSFSHDLYSLETRTGTLSVLLTAASILAGAEEKLSAEERARRERMRELTRGIVSFRLSRDGKRLLVPLSGRLFLVELATRSVTELRGASTAFPIDPRLSPDGEHVSCVRDGDLYLFDRARGEERRLTRRSSPSITNGLAEFVAQEEMGRHRGYWWSPDSTRIVYQETDTSSVERLQIADPSRLAEAARSEAYPRAGRANAAVRLGVLSLDGGETRWIAWDRARYPYLVNVRWTERAPLTIVVQNRAQTELALLTVDPGSGATQPLLVERDPAWVNIDPQMPRWLEGGERFLWTSEREGAWQLELRDRRGQLVRVVTRNPGYSRLLDVDAKRQELFFLASPPGRPEEQQLHRAPLSGGGAVQVSTERGLHDALFSRGHTHYVHTVHPLAGTRRTVVRRRDGSILASIPSLAERPPFAPNLQLVSLPVALDGTSHDLRAALVRPRAASTGRYPVVVYVYGGPGVQVVTASAERYLLQQWIADHGFVVVSLDGRGTPGRGRAWERAIKGNLVRVPLEDQVAGLRALGLRFPELDLERVGVYGWSFGGHLAAMAALLRPEVFRAAAAVAPVASWEDYDTHYTERYLGLPAENRAGYRESSALSHAAKLQRPLLLIHGTSDDNVYFAHSLRLSDALFRAGRRHEFLPLTNFTHLVPDPLVTRRLYGRIAAFLREGLAR
jgi:dipeptidyl-peptidase-4